MTWPTCVSFGVLLTAFMMFPAWSTKCNIECSSSQDINSVKRNTPLRLRKTPHARKTASHPSSSVSGASSDPKLSTLYSRHVSDDKRNTVWSRPWCLAGAQTCRAVKHRRSHSLTLFKSQKTQEPKETPCWCGDRLPPLQRLMLSFFSPSSLSFKTIFMRHEKQ